MNTTVKKETNEVTKALTGHPYKIGENYFFRTVTMHIIGKLEEVYDSEFLVSKACWVADSGRFNKALKTGELSEVEPFEDDVIIGRGSIVDVTKWNHPLGREVVES